MVCWEQLTLLLNTFHEALTHCPTHWGRLNCDWSIELSLQIGFDLSAVLLHELRPHNIEAPRPVRNAPQGSIFEPLISERIHQFCGCRHACMQNGMGQPGSSPAMTPESM